jgi:hypothetical protein
MHVLGVSGPAKTQQDLAGLTIQDFSPLGFDEDPARQCGKLYLASGLSRSMLFASGDGAMDRTHV